MKKLFGALLVLLVSVAAALWFQDQGGFVVIHFGEWSVQVRVFFFVGAIIASVFLLYLIVGIIRGLLGLPSGMRRWIGERKQNRTRARLVEGMIRTAEGRYADAEKVLLKDIERAEAPELHYLAAAVAAQRLEAPERRNEYLAKADRSGRKAGLAIGLIQAQLQYEGGELEQALASLNYLHDRAPNNRRVLKLLLQVCEQLKDWERIDTLVPELRKQGVLNEPEAYRLQVETAKHRLETALRRNERDLDAVWQSLAKPVREDDSVLLIYVDALSVKKREDEAEKLLRTRLQKRWSADLVARYGALRDASDKALPQLDKWLKERPEDPVLLFAAGRQCLRGRLWGRARSYFEAAVARNPQAEIYQALGGLLEQLGETDAARECFRKAVELFTGQPTLAELSETDKAALAGHGTSAGS
ncbi:hypothetical protein CAI21_15320 [Alkalilimnicola ehrlichii]|uniref:HemY N-terminal domain-containing protein n=1 Tax=Alkalilimnicola ehrlichii TaxID=351052 RepID=A0A3E0WRC3_9GAMM|nr:heme biosynthesis HemY N-terminal domain-containing protein [Alkalilimnicola ehrlichii]RFA27215.1 hypothetical protein CAI21_15320 [Alkalilimnicola ehrlichii]RFA35388.1 hypothetical protein CAL65_12985 [Alkalilimnicola ehrlichii]